ncbi:glycine hydroxymethyltransferase [Ruminiclostridium sufflavum DSM 19573]|uniref:Glycine hydroxymethyltransferase n=1 Tax=Ruminiclostridium sufflavum DSM 19573 TaxID=1121337 RepID=A0A318XNI5_9FIRM|nr:GNAT family N-acetyltransferase [Ruminiclostridium sufflavum]PYG88396.1 glycine hydroxymethyltransferase [Ruminiclostridium sufflavum DSM 19573]
MKIEIFNPKNTTEIIKFFDRVYKQNKRILNVISKDKDLMNIQREYIENGNFWVCLNNNQVIATIALRKLSDCFELRRFFVLKKYQKKGIGSNLLDIVLNYAIDNGIKVIKAATMTDGTVIRTILLKYGFTFTKRYNNSSADLFFVLKLTTEYEFNHKLRQIKNQFESSLILNPTENIPVCSSKTKFMEGLYVSERFKDVNDKVIFAGRNDTILFFEYIKKVWKDKLKASDVDLKTLSGLNAHLILFLCIIRKGDSVVLLSEDSGGHFATQKILESIGAKTYLLIPDIENQCIDIAKSRMMLERVCPQFIFIDRSEGLIYEDFSWLSDYKQPYKIFDASQYLTQIIVERYESPFNWGFDMIVSTLHKNYPGPQKGIIAVKDSVHEIWNRYLMNAKTYISNTHPLGIANSLLPVLDFDSFRAYSDDCIACANELDKKLCEAGLPVTSRGNKKIPTLHIWLEFLKKEEGYYYYLKLEQLKILTNYRLLPYEKGYGLRIGINGAVRQGLRLKHINDLAQIMGYAYHNEIDNMIIKKAEKLVKSIIVK